MSENKVLRRTVVRKTEEVTRGYSEERHYLCCFPTSNMSRTVRWPASVVNMSTREKYVKMLWNITDRTDKYERSIARSVDV